MLRQDTGIGHVGQPFPLLHRAGKTKERLVSRQMVAATARVTPTFVDVPTE